MSEFALFVAMESHTRLIRVFIPLTKSIRAVCRADFHLTSTGKLLSLSSLLDGLSRQANVEAEQETEDGLTEEHLVNATASTAHKIHLEVYDEPRVPSFL